LRDRAVREKFYDLEKDLKDIQDLSLFELTTWKSKMRFSNESHSDQIAYLNAFN